jgi:hypothetical protein
MTVGVLAASRGINSLFVEPKSRFGRLQRQAYHCLNAEPEPTGAVLATWCWAHAVLIEWRPITLYERQSMWRATRSIGARLVRRWRGKWVWRLPGECMEKPLED